MTTLSKPGLRPANPNFSSGPCAKRPGWSPAALKHAALGRSHRAKIGKSKLEQAIELTREVLRGSFRLPHRHRAGVRHRRRRDGAVVAARRPRRRHGRLGILRRRLGHRCGQAAQAAGYQAHRGRLWRTARSLDHRLFARCGLHVERHDLGCAGARCRFHPGRPAGPDDLRRDLSSLRPKARFPETRCRHLLLAEGAGRRRRARHADPLAARRRAAGDIQAGLAAAQNLSPDPERQADRRHFRGRDDQHAVDALRRGLFGRAGNGRSRSAASMR